MHMLSSEFLLLASGACSRPVCSKRIVPAAEEQLVCDHHLRSAGYVLNGILNGIDMSVWNPEQDTFIEHNYSLGNYSSGKAANKLALQKELGLPERDVSI
jgi:glycogen synthase